MWLRRLRPGDWIVAALMVLFTVPTSISLLGSAAPWVMAVGGTCIAVLTALLFVRRPVGSASPGCESGRGPSAGRLDICADRTGTEVRAWLPIT